MKYKIFTVVISTIAFIVASFYITSQFIKPSPKKELTIATGGQNGNYYKTALKYKELLEEENVKVNILTSAGSVENMKLLKENKADIAFVQNGIAAEEKVKNLEALASIYYEPLWVFYKHDSYTMDYVIQLISKKIAIGEIGSGTRDLALKILSDNGIDNTNSELLDISSSNAKQMLLDNEIDALFAVTSHNSQVVKELLANPKINVLSFKRAKAYSRKYPFLEALTLYEGTLDLYKNLPDENINLLSTTATLVANKNISNELIRLLLKKVKQVHKKKDLFARPNQFPNTNNMQLETNEEAQRYFKYGDTWLEKIFPYWIASNIDRLKILLIPLLTLLFPLFKGVFPLYNWTMRSKIYKWYDELKTIDEELDNLDKEALKKELEKVETLQKEIKNETKVPLSYMGEYYNLQLHIEHIENRIRKRV